MLCDMKKSLLPSREELKEARSPYLDVEIAAVRGTIDRARRNGYRLKTIWRSLHESGDITGTYSGFRRALLRTDRMSENIDEVRVNELVVGSSKSNSERESEAAIAEAKAALAARAKTK